MGHRDGRAVALTPSLIGITERRCGAGNGVNPHGGQVIFVHHLGRGTSLTHCFGIECPVHVPSCLCFSHKKGADSDLMLR